MIELRYELSLTRIMDIVEDAILPGRVGEFFTREAEFILHLTKIYDLKHDDELCKLDYVNLKKLNHTAYEHQVNITYANAQNEAEVYLCALDAELKAAIPYAYEGRLEEIVIRLELFLEMYSSFITVREDGLEYPTVESLKDILFYYVSDYTYDTTENKISSMLTLNEDFATHIVMNEDWNDVRSLYLYGEYVTEIQEETLKHVSSLSYEKLKKMADTYTEGYRIGFEVANKDLSKKKIVDIRYSLGFEPVIKIAIQNFKEMGLKPTIRRASFNLLMGRGVVKNGYQGGCVSRQYDYEHKDDESLFMDGRIVTVKLEALQKAFEKHKEEAALYAGPAVMEVFGEDAPKYITVDNAPSYSNDQNKLLVKLRGESMDIQSKYILEEERSFTIIAFPTPDISDNYSEIFDEVIKLNTLDYKLYQNIQQTIIDTMDKGQYALIKGRNGNLTNLKVSLHKIDKPDSQTQFENCVADVNIPVGEVFTSPVLKGTEGKLHVKKVFLNGLEYDDFMLTIKDGMIKEYTCRNFPTEEENKKYIKDNVMFCHESLPMGEFAIGTNTTAYTMGKKYGIEDKLPILIAEKTGPHFAFGDTCYSHCEDIAVFNPDGKEIISKDNECSLLRSTNPLKAYFNCHTDVTIPYDELGEISVVTYDNEVILIIEDGRFVLDGTGELNEALL